MSLYSGVDLRFMRMGQSSCPAARLFLSPSRSCICSGGRNIFSHATDIGMPSKGIMELTITSCRGKELGNISILSCSRGGSTPALWPFRGSDFVQYIHIWINCLSKLIRTTHDMRRTNHLIRCPASCNVIETLPTAADRIGATTTWVSVLVEDIISNCVQKNKKMDRTNRKELILPPRRSKCWRYFRFLSRNNIMSIQNILCIICNEFIKFHHNTTNL